MRNADAIKSYSRRGKKAVEGWFHRIDAEIFSTLLSCQEMNGIVGGCCEIGVHHGKSFIPLCLSLKANELALCIDIFEEQTGNLDVSGHGDREKLFENLARFGIDLSRVRVFAESSENITAERILKEVGPVRFFSIDGGHWEAIVVNDLTLAERSLSRGGIIALDDAFRTDWPEVTFGASLWLNATKGRIIPFAMGTNKLYFCEREFAPLYRVALRSDYLNTFFVKTYRSEDFEIDSYRFENRDQDETELARLPRAVLTLFFPDLLVWLKSSKNAVRRLGNGSARLRR